MGALAIEIRREVRRTIKGHDISSPKLNRRVSALLSRITQDPLFRETESDGVQPPQRRTLDLESLDRTRIFQGEPLSAGQSSGDYYLEFPPGAVFIGREPTTIASAEDLQARKEEQLRTLHAKIGNGEEIDHQWLIFLDHTSEKVLPEERLQNPA